VRYALGIDGGGSKCDAALVDETGAVVGWGRGGPIHIFYDPPEVISASFRDAVAGALAGRRLEELWVAGSTPRRESSREVLTSAAEVVHYREAGEVDTAYASVQEEWGLIVLAGTGSFVHGRTRDGRNVHWGGTGPVLNDYGSAYDIGLRGLRAAFRSHWTESRRTALAKAIPAALQVKNLGVVFHMIYVDTIQRGQSPGPQPGSGEQAEASLPPMNRRQIAALAKVVNDEAEGGDRIAQECVLRAADEMAANAADMIRELHMEESAVPVIAIGGVAQRSRIWWERVCKRIAAVAPRMRPLMPRVQPATGAALIGLREMGIAWAPELIDRLAATERGARPGADKNGEDDAGS
jgi:N-acetylglucosamine kinase-like BadF-type ATPase